MKYYSTKEQKPHYNFREAVLQGLPKDNGLFMPEEIPVLTESELKFIRSASIADIAYTVCRKFIGEEIPDNTLKEICSEAFNFPVPLVQLNDQTYIAELFHSPTLAFKDFGARFMARVMSYLNRNESKKLTILVATSGDTGGAVADGFFGVEGTEVFILYPSGGVSELQEKQLTTYGGNIHAIEVKGTFDDCQRLVKSAFLDEDLSNLYRLSSANSINIARLIPQMVYYFAAHASLKTDEDVFFVVPSGNFGNLTAGLFAKRMGLAVKNFVAATNANDSVVNYLGGKGFHPHPSVATISNAMDVGNPSNFGRMLDLYGDSADEMEKDIWAWSVSDSETEQSMRDCYNHFQYICDPHGAVGLAGWKIFQEETPGTGIILETAHPAKFIETVESVLGINIPLPAQLERLRSLSKSADLLKAEFSDLKAFLMARKA